MHDIWKSIPNLLPALLLLFIGEIATCTHPVRQLVFQPHQIQSIPPFPAEAAHLERFRLKTEQGDVEGWLFVGDGVDASQPGPAVLMAHGNRELIDHYLNRAHMYQRMGFTVLLGEYRGYGRSAGTPSRKRIASDYRRFYDHLTALPNVVPVKHALEINRQIPNAELILYDCGHSDCPPVWETYWKDITEFLNGVVSN